MTRTDADAGATEFFDSVLAGMPLPELWLGRSQSFGRGQAGSQATIARLAEQRGVRRHVLPRPPAEGANAGYQALRLLADGRLADAIDQVGYPPVWRRPRSALLRLPWRPGRYRAARLEEARTLARLLDAFALERGGHLAFSIDGPRVVTPGYMVGYAGVAMCLLRLADPHRRPHQLSRAGFRYPT